MAEQQSTAPGISELGEAIYDRLLRDRMEAEHMGKFVLIHVDTEDYEIDEDEVQAALRAQTRHPDGRWYAIRIGELAACHIGWRKGRNS